MLTRDTKKLDGYRLLNNWKRSEETIMDQDIKDFLSFVEFSDETIAATEEDLDSTPYQPGVCIVRPTEPREPATTLFERTR